MKWPAGLELNRLLGNEGPGMDKIWTPFGEAGLSETPVIQSLFELVGLSKGVILGLIFGPPDLGKLQEFN